MRTFQHFLFVTAVLVLSGCSLLSIDINDIKSAPANMLVVVNGDIYNSIKPSIDQYSTDLAEAGSGVFLEIWNDGSVSDLQTLIFTHPEKPDAALLVGNIPAAWYEQTSFDDYEKFPCDIFLMSSATVWYDNDKDGYYDSHSPIYIDVYVSRINGSAEELNFYFQKIKNFKDGITVQNNTAYIFKDDDWFDFKRGSKFGLDKVFSTIYLSETSSSTVKSKYKDNLASPAVDFVYQWIHANPLSLYIDNNSSYEKLPLSEIDSTINGSFYNMFNCSAARFTQDNLGMTYLTKTATGLAVTGSTKVGGNYHPYEFNKALSLGGSWGNAFQVWYNYYGHEDDEWYLGMTILGDPTLQITEKSPTARSFNLMQAFPTITPVTDEERESLYRNLLDFEKNTGTE